MKKFTVSAIVAMGIVVLSSAAFAGTTSADYRGLANGTDLAIDTVVPTDTIVPEQKDTTKSEPVEQTPVEFALADTIVPEKEGPVVPEKKDEKQTESKTQSLTDTVVPADTLTPAKKEDTGK